MNTKDNPNAYWKNLYWGHPEAESIKSTEYAQEKAEVDPIISRLVTSVPDVSKHVNSIDNWLQASLDKRFGVGLFHRRRLWNDGIRGKDIIIEACAIYIFWLRNPGRIKDHKHLTHLIGNKVLRIVPFADYTDGYAHAAFGNIALNKFWVPVFKLVCTQVDRLKDMERSERNRMCSPLEID